MTEEKKLALKEKIRQTAKRKYPDQPDRQKEYLWRVYQTIKDRQQ